MKTAKILVYIIVQYIEILHYLSKNRLDTKMLRVHLFSFFTIKMPRTLPFGIIIL